MTETQERFLRTVLSRVPLDSVVELHLFPPIRRGTLETGVAVIATLLPLPTLTVHEDIDAADDVANVADAAAARAAIESAAVDAENSAPVDTNASDAAADDLAPDDAIAAAEAVAPAPAPRFRILTAGYRHTIKGVERGKWSVEVQDEADAPLHAVEAVLRGVRHRSAEPADPELVGHEALAALLASGAIAPAA